MKKEAFTFSHYDERLFENLLIKTASCYINDIYDNLFIKIGLNTYLCEMKKREIYMLQIQKALVSLDVVEKKFCCDLAACKGICCVEGDSGAPLTEEEVDQVENEYPNFVEYMRPEGIAEVEKQGNWVVDVENDQVTPLVNQKECAYVIFEDGVAKCAIEKAFFEGKTSFRKPVSCHLYPIRIKKYEHFTAVNYDVWDICKPALDLGKRNGSFVFEFVKDGLIRYFGQAWYDELVMAARALENQGDKP